MGRVVDDGDVGLTICFLVSRNQKAKCDGRFAFWFPENIKHIFSTLYIGEALSKQKHGKSNVTI